MIWVIRNSPLNNIVQFGMLSCTTMETWSLIICQLTRRRLAGFLVSGKLITLPQYSYSVQRHNIQQVGQHRSQRVLIIARVQVTQVRVGQHWSQLGYRLHRLGQVNIVHCQGIGHIGQGRSTLVLAMVQVTQVRIGQHRSQLVYRSHRSGQVNTVIATVQVTQVCTCKVGQHRSQLGYSCHIVKNIRMFQLSISRLWWKTDLGGVSGGNICHELSGTKILSFWKLFRNNELF